MELCPSAAERAHLNLPPQLGELEAAGGSRSAGAGSVGARGGVLRNQNNLSPEKSKFKYHFEIPLTNTTPKTIKKTSNTGQIPGNLEH